MNKRERVLAALEGRKTDYVPGCFWKHFPSDKSKGEIFIREQIKFYRDTDEDFLKISCDGYFGWPEECLRNLEQPSQLYHMKRLGTDHPFIREQIERAKAVASLIKEEVCCFYTMFCPLSYFRLQVGWDKMMQCIRKDPEAVKYACSVIAEDLCELVRGILEESGCDGIFYSVQNAEINRFTYQEYRDWVTPSDRKVLEYANTLSKYNILHCCGWDADEAGTVNRIEVWQDYPAAAINWASSVDGMDAGEVCAFFGVHAAWGGFDNRKCGTLYRGTKEEVQKETRRLIKNTENFGYLLGPDCSLPDDISEERIRWVLEEARKGGIE